MVKLAIFNTTYALPQFILFSERDARFLQLVDLL